MSRVCVVGAGAAGLTAALRAVEAGASVTLLNAHPKIGLKILMSGGTRCNVTHREVTAADFNGGSRNVIARILREFPADSARRWLESLGVRLKLEETGKWFPETDDAQTVLDALLGAVSRAGVSVATGARVVRLERSDGGGFRLGVQEVANAAAFAAVRRSAPSPDEPSRWEEADAVVMATGGLSFPRTGSDGTGYSLLEKLGHTLVEPIPALTPLTADDPWCRALQGVTLPAELTLGRGRSAVRCRGSMLFAHFGYSGPAALDMSRHWLRAGANERELRLSLLPGATLESEEKEWLEGSEVPARTVRRHFAKRLPESVVVEAGREAGVEPAMKLGQVSRGDRRRLIHALISRALPVTGTLGYEKAEVTAGGVRLGEVDPRTLESRVVPGLFLCGEVLDVEGRLGGFNFQWAWSSGTVAGRAAGST